MKYPNIGKNKRNILYPCDVKMTEGKDHKVVYTQLIFPQLLQKIMQSYGFETVFSQTFGKNDNTRGSFVIIAKKTS